MNTLTKKRKELIPEVLSIIEKEEEENLPKRVTDEHSIGIKRSKSGGSTLPCKQFVEQLRDATPSDDEFDNIKSFILNLFDMAIPENVAVCKPVLISKK